MVHYINNGNKQNSLRRGLLIGTLAVSTLAASIFGVNYYQSRDELNELRGQLQQSKNELNVLKEELSGVNKPNYRENIENRLTETYEKLKDKTDEIIPEIKKDYRKIAIYGGIGILGGLAMAYLYRRKK